MLKYYIPFDKRIVSNIIKFLFEKKGVPFFPQSYFQFNKRITCPKIIILLINFPKKYTFYSNIPFVSNSPFLPRLFISSSKMNTPFHKCIASP